MAAAAGRAGLGAAVSGGTMPVCGNCGLVLNTNGTCTLCDRRRIVRTLTWWELFDLQWQRELAVYDRRALAGAR